MDKSKQYFLWIFLIFTLIVGMIWQFYPLPTAQSRLNKIPLVGPNFSGQDVPLSKLEETFFKNINLIKRVYEIDGKYYFITILDGSHNRHIVHDPYYCFRGGGWEIDSERPYAVSEGNFKIIEIHKDNEKREALYFFSDGTSAYTDPLYYWWQTTLRRLTLGKSSPEPILIMIQPVVPEKVDWDKVVKTLNPLFFKG